MIYIFLADGFEEIEAVTAVDVLRRANIEAKTVGVSSNMVRGANNIVIQSDIGISDITTDGIEGIILPGGMPGTKNLDKSQDVHKIINYCEKNGLLIAAICAAPLVLGHIGILRGKRSCCYPGFEGELSGAEITNDDVCVSGNVITSRGPGASLKFALSVVEYISGKQAAEKIRVSVECR